MDGPHVRPATLDDVEAINGIYNAEILEGVATWDLEPWPLERRQAWLRELQSRNLAVLVACVDTTVIGFGYLSMYRDRGGYRYTREDTVYIDPAYHRRGAGRALLGALIEEARALGVHCLVAQIEASNTASVELHRAFGFEQAGYARQLGWKFDRWLDLITMQLLLEPFQTSVSFSEPLPGS
jgi:L-amino acid N-acyltransferase